MYTTDLHGLLSLLTGSEQSGTLTLQPETHLPVWQACFTFERGQPTTGVVTVSNKVPVRVEPTRAIAELSTRGTLWWTFEPPSSKAAHTSRSLRVTAVNAHSAPGHSGSTDDPSPWRFEDRPCRVKGAPHPDEWERLQRSIFALIDGKRTVQEITHLLQTPLNDLQPFLYDLYRSGWIGKVELARV